MTIPPGSRGGRRAAVAGGMALLLFAATAVAVHAGAAGAPDVAVRRWVLAHRHPALVPIFAFCSAAGGVTGMRVLAALGAVDLWRRGWRRLAACVLALAVASFYSFTALKLLFGRLRPGVLLTSPGTDFAFPSGHAVMSAAVCGTLALVYHRQGLAGRRAALLGATLVPLTVGVSRLVLDAHWATDVVGGWSLGALFAVVTGALASRLGAARDG